MIWIFDKEGDQTPPMIAMISAIKNLRFIRLKGKRRLSYGISLVICMAILAVCTAQGAGTPGSSQSDDQSRVWDKPFASPQYLLHATGHGRDPRPSEVGFHVKDDLWFLNSDQPKDGFLQLPIGYGGTVLPTIYYIDQVLGPFNTPREVCTDASGKTRDSSIGGPPHDGRSLDIGAAGEKTKDSSLGEFNCKDMVAQPENPNSSTNSAQNCPAECKARNAIWNGKDEYPYCNCVCEKGYEFDSKGQNCVLITSESGAGSTSDMLVQTASGTTVLKPGDSVPLPAKLSANCKQLFDLVILSWDRDLWTTIYNRIVAPDPQSKNPNIDRFVRVLKVVLALDICTGGALTGDEGFIEIHKKERLVTQAASDSPSLLGSSGSSGLPTQIELGLQQGPLRAEVVNDRVSLSVKTETAIVTSSGKNAFGVAYDPSSGTTFVAAYQGPVSVEPMNSNLVPFTLDAGQIVEVSSVGVGPTTLIGQNGTNGTAPGSGATGVPGITGNATLGGEGISASGGPSASGTFGTGTSTGGTVSPSGNNQIGDAANISAGQFVSQAINPAGSSNFYRFYAETSGILELKLESIPTDMRPQIHLFDKNFGRIDSKYASNPGDSLQLEKDILGPGWFYIEVSDQDGKAHVESYALKTSFQPAPDRYEPNPNYYRASEAKPGQTVSAYICPVNDEDFYKVYVASSGIFKLNMESVPQDMKSEISIFDKSFGSSVAFSAASNPGDKVSLVKDIAGPGWYFIKVRDIEGKAHRDPYSLKISFEPAPDQYEPNPNFFRATDVVPGLSITAYICPVNDEDFYKFHVGAQGVVKVTLDGVPAEMKSFLSIYDKTWSQPIASSGALNPGDKVSLEKDVQGPSWYYIKVHDSTGKALSEPYTLTVAM